MPNQKWEFWGFELHRQVTLSGELLSYSIGGSMARSKAAIKDERLETQNAWDAAVKYIGAASPPDRIKIKDIEEPVPLNWILDPVHGLSIKMRMRIALTESELHRDAIIAQTGVSLATISNWKSLKKPLTKEPKGFTGFLSLLTESVRSGGPDIGKAEFRDDIYTHLDAPAKFANWVRTGVKEAGDGLELLNRQFSYPWYGTSPRTTDLRKLSRSLLDPSGPVISVVHSEYTANGMTAFAEELIWRHLKKSGRSQAPNICYIPLRTAQVPEGPVSYSQVIGWILAFTERRSMIDAEPVPVGSKEVEAINAIRLALAKDPAIFLFDGHAVNLPTMPDLEAVITGAPLPDIVRQIVHPRTSPECEPGISDNLRKTRAVILSSHAFPENAFLESTLHIRMKSPPTSAYTDIFEQLDLENADLIRDKLNGDMPAFDETSIALFDALLSYRPDAKISLMLRRADTLATELMAELRANHSVAFLLLHLSSTLFGPLRRSTALKLARQHVELVTETGSNEYSVGETQLISEGDLDEAAQLLNAILITSPDTHSPELDSEAHPGEELAGNIQDDANPGAHAEELCYEFRSPSLRKAIRKALLAEMSARSIAFSHRLLAEEALKQYAIILRHSAEMDVSSIRFHGRLLQAMYHALLATAANPADIDVLKATHALVLPPDPTDAFTTALFRIYMGGLEAPPNWTLSREFGAERIRRDFLLLALNSAPGAGLTKLELKILGEQTLGIETPDWFAKTGARAELAIKELLLNFARSAMHIHDLDPALEAMNQTRNLALNCEDIDLGEVDKLETDLELIRDDLPGARARVEATLDSTLDKSISSELDEIVESLAGIAREDAAGALESAIFALAQKFYIACSSKKGQLNTAALLDAADHLNRLAEVEAQVADHQTAVSEAEFAREGFLRAFIGFSVVNCMLGEVFSDNPVAPIRYTHAHSSRIFIRVCVVLQRYASSKECEEFGVPFAEYFQIAARQESNTLSRDVHRHPTERAALLILEAVFYRTTIGGDEARAKKMLQDADLHMVRGADRVRLRARYYFERLKTGRQLAKAALENGQKDLAGAYLKDAQYDKDRLEMITRALSPSYWDSLCGTQEEKLERLESEIEAG